MLDLLIYALRACVVLLLGGFRLVALRRGQEGITSVTALATALGTLLMAVVALLALLSRGGP